MSPNSVSVHSLKVSSDDVELCHIVTYEKGKSFHFYISYKDSSLCVLSRSVPIDVRDYKQRLYKALSISFAAYLMLED